MKAREASSVERKPQRGVRKRRDSKRTAPKCTCWLEPDIRIELLADGSADVYLLHGDESCPLWPKSGLR